MTAFFTRMPFGVAGDLSRPGTLQNTESQAPNASALFTSFGVPGKLAAGLFQPIASAADVVYGFLRRPFPTEDGSSTPGLGTSQPASTAICNVLRKGYMYVNVNAGSPAAGGAVFVRVANASTGKPIGGVEAAAEFATTTGTAGGSNTGNGTIGTLSAAVPAQNGNYLVTFTAATVFTVSDPNGVMMAQGKTSAAYTDRGVTFTITAGGTPFVAGDTFTVAVTANCVVIPNCQFSGPKDTSNSPNVAEISFGGPNL